MILRYPLNIEEIKIQTKPAILKPKLLAEKSWNFTQITPKPPILLAKYNKLPKFTKPTMGIRAK